MIILVGVIALAGAVHAAGESSNICWPAQVLLGATPYSVFFRRTLNAEIVWKS